MIPSNLVRIRLAEAGFEELHLRHVVDREPQPCEALDGVKDFIRDGAKLSTLVLAGGMGTRKTGAATWWASQVASMGRVAFVSGWDLSRAMGFDEGSRKLMQRLLEVDYLVIDDLGSEYADQKGFFAAGVSALCCSRDAAATRKTVITGNFTDAGFKHSYPRLADRMRARGLFFVVDGDSVRGKSSK